MSRFQGFKAWLAPLWRRFVKFAKYWQEVPTAAVAIIGLIIAFYMLPRFDPNSGIDGFGSLFSLGLAVVTGQVIAFSAWWCKSHYMVDPTDEEEKTMMDRASRGDGQWAFAIERASFFGWLVLWYLVVKH